MLYETPPKIKKGCQLTTLTHSHWSISKTIKNKPSQLLPLKPPGQVQLYSFSRLLQVPLFLQGLPMQ